MQPALKQALPAICCYFPLGIVYAIVCSQHGLPWYYAPLASAFVYAGAMQFLALTIMAAGGSLLTLAISLIPLGLRNVFYGLTHFERYKNAHPLLRIYLSHGLVDATYSILITGPHFDEEKKDLRYIIWLTTLIHLSWVLGSLLGTFVDLFYTLPDGLGFSLTAFFAASSVEQMLKKREIKPLLIAAVSIAVTLVILPNHLFLAAMGMAMVSILILPSRKRSVA